MLTRNRILLILIALVLCDGMVWGKIAAGKSDDAELYFLSVGQGDAEFIRLPGGVEMLIDGGPSNAVLNELGDVMGPTDRYIDFVAMTHPQTDHYMGLIDVITRYQVGAFLYNGEGGPQESFKSLVAALKERDIPIIRVGEGDVITYGKERIEVLSPSKELVTSKEPNDGSVVMKVIHNNKAALFTGDGGINVEEYIQRYNLKSDVLKVGHHGSRFSSSKSFLNAVTPSIAIIEVGKNTYGHPTQEALARLGAVGAQIFRTDTDGAIKIVLGEEIRVMKRK